MIREWRIVGPGTSVVWTPEEMAQIGRAVQAFQAALPGGGKRDVVSLDDIGVISPATLVDWTQPGEGVLVNPVATKVDGTSALS